MKFKIKFADQIVGLFILVALVLLSVIIILVGMNQRWFSKDYAFHSSFQSATGVSPGTSIVMKGFTVGKISRITLNETNTVDVDFNIYDTYVHLVREFSILELTVSPIGLGSQLLFHPGRGDTLLEEGSFIPRSDSPEGIAWIEQELVDIPPKDDTITRLLTNVNPLLENVNKTVVTINRTLTEVNRALAGQSSGPLGSIVGDVSDATARLPGTMDDVDGIIADVQSRVGGLMDQVSSLLLSLYGVSINVEEISADIAVTTESMRDPTGLVPKLLDPKGSLKTFLDDDNVLYKQVLGMTSDIEKSIKSIQSIISGLNSEMPKIAAVLNETRTAILQAQDVLQGVKNNPLIRGGVPERVEQESLFRSMREGSFE